MSIVIVHLGVLEFSKAWPASKIQYQFTHVCPST